MKLFLKQRGPLSPPARAALPALCVMALSVAILVTALSLSRDEPVSAQSAETAAWCSAQAKTLTMARAAPQQDAEALMHSALTGPGAETSLQAPGGLVPMLHTLAWLCLPVLGVLMWLVTRGGRSAAPAHLVPSTASAAFTASTAPTRWTAWSSLQDSAADALVLDRPDETLPPMPPAPPALWAPPTPAAPRPLARAGQSLASALEQELEQRRQQVQKPGSKRTLSLMLAPGSAHQRLPSDVETAALWVARECLDNALLAGHHSDVVVHLHAYDLGLRLEVHDSSYGLFGLPSAPPVASGWPRDLDQHRSVVAMRERSAAMGGRLTLRSDPFTGTRVILRWLP